MNRLTRIWLSHFICLRMLKIKNNPPFLPNTVLRTLGQGMVTISPTSARSQHAMLSHTPLHPAKAEICSSGQFHNRLIVRCVMSSKERWSSINPVIRNHFLTNIIDNLQFQIFMELKHCKNIEVYTRKQEFSAVLNHFNPPVRDVSIFQWCPDVLRNSTSHRWLLWGSIHPKMHILSLSLSLIDVSGSSSWAETEAPEGNRDIQLIKSHPF